MLEHDTTPRGNPRADLQVPNAMTTTKKILFGYVHSGTARLAAVERCTLRTLAHMIIMAADDPAAGQAALYIIGDRIGIDVRPPDPGDDLS